MVLSGPSTCHGALPEPYKLRGSVWLMDFQVILERDVCGRAQSCDAARHVGIMAHRLSESILNV